MIEQVVLYIIGFSIFVGLQSLVINGIKTCFEGGCINDLDKGRVCKGMIFYKLNPEFFEINKDKWWAHPIYVCIKCMASFWGACTYWPIVLWLFGFHYSEVPIFIFDMFILTYLNYFFYKKI
jgi:hypothetical protein